MDNYGNDYFMSQEGYASIDFTLLDRPNSNIASAPESTAALLPDLHVADSSFSSFDFLDGPGVDAFGGVLRDADEAHSRDQGGYRSELQKYKKERSLQNSVGLHRGDGDTDSELPSAEFQIPFEVQKPISNLDFFSQGQTKESGHTEQHAHSDPGNETADANHDYFDQGQISQQTHTGSGTGGGWYNTWVGNANQGDQTQIFFQTPSYEEPSDERRLMQMKGGSTQLAGQMGYHSLSGSQVPSGDPGPKATHSFLPTAKQSDVRQAANMGLGQPSAHVNGPPSAVIKSSPRNQPFDYEGLMNGSSANQFRQSSAAAVENTAATRRHQTNDTNLGGQDALRSHAQSQNYKYTGQTLGSLAPVEAAPLKVNDYDFLGGQYVLKGQTQGEIGQQLGVPEMQTWHQHSLVAQSNQQPASYQQPYQDLSRHHQHQVDQQTQHSRQQQLQQFLAVSHQNQSLGNQSLGNQSLGNQSLGNQLSAFLGESSLQDLPRVVQPDRQNSQLAVDNPRGLMLSSYQPVNNWSATDPSNMQGLAHDYLMGSDQNFNWQALALKASQVDPSMYSSVPVHRRDTSGQPVGAYAGMQGGSLQEYFAGAAKLNPVSPQVGKPVARSHGSGGTGGSMFGSEYQPEVYDAAASLQNANQGNKHQALGNMPFWQNPYPQAVEHNRSDGNLGQTNLPPRSPQVPANSQVRQQRNWTALSGQQDTLQGGLFAQNLVNAEALKQSILAGATLQHNSHQSANPHQSSRPQTMEAAHYIQQSSSQAASGSQFLNALGTKQQTNWSRQSPQPWNSAVNNVENWQLNRGESNSGSNSSQAASGSQFLNALGTKQPATWSRPSQQAWNSGVNEVESWQLSRGGESNNATSELPIWSRGQNVTGRNVVDQLNLGAESNSGINEVMPSWSRGQHTAAQKDLEQFNIGDSNRGRNEVLSTWTRGQNLSAQKDAEQLNLGGESKSGMNEAQTTWSRGQNMSARKDVEQLNLVGELGSGANDIMPSWSRGQGAAVRKDVEQLNAGGESNSGMNNLPAWSRGQSVLARKDVGQLNHAGESNSDTTELPIWSRGQSLPSRNVVDQLDLGADSNSGIHEVMPTWSRGQNTTARKDVEHFNLGGELRNSNEVLPTWSRAQSIPVQKDLEQPNLAVEPKSGMDDSQPAWSRGQSVSAQKDVEQLNLVGESDTGVNDIIPTWSRGQNTPVRKDMDQLNLGDPNSGINTLPAWSRGQSLISRKDNVEQLNRSGEPNNSATELPVWSRGQSVLARNVVEQSNLASESNNGMNEVMPTWSRGQNTPTRKDGDQFNLGGDLSRGSNDVQPTWSRGQNPPARKDVEQFNLGGESNRVVNEMQPTWSRGQNAAVQKDVDQFSLGAELNRVPNELPTWSRGQNISAQKGAEQSNREGVLNSGKTDSAPAWSRGQSAPSHKDAEQLNQAADTNSAGTNSSGKDLLNTTIEAEKRPQEEMSFLEGGTLRESNSVASPAPSPDSNVFSSAMKQKASGKVSSLSRNTLELLSKPEEPIESSSMIDEDDEEEELDQEDSGANASSISLAHLRRNQASGPLSPQGFGLRLAPPSHLSQVGNSSRLVNSLSNLGADASQGISAQTVKEQQQSALSGVNDQLPAHQTSMGNVDKIDSAVADEIGTSAVQGTTPGTGATSNSQYDSQLRSQEYKSAEGAEQSLMAAGKVDGNSTQLTTSPAPNVKSGVHQSFLSGQHSEDMHQPTEASNSASTQVIDGMINRISEEGFPTSNSFGSSQAHSMGHLASSISQKAQSNLAVQQSGSSQTAAFSKLLSSFKDSLAEQGKQTSAQHHGLEKGNSDRGSVGSFDSFRSQSGKQINGLQPAQWSLDGAQMSSVKAEIFKRFSAQVQNKSSQPTFGQMSVSNNNNNNNNNNNSEQTSAGSDSFPGQMAVASHFLPGQQTLNQGADLPGQAMGSSQSHSGQSHAQGQALPGQETTPSHSGQIHNQNYPTGQGHGTENSYPGQLFNQNHTVSGQAMLLDQSQSLQMHTPAGQSNAPAYQGLFGQNQTLSGQVSSHGQSYTGQTYNATQDPSGPSHPGQIFVQVNSFPGQANTPGQSLSGPDTPGQPGSGQVTSPALSNKQNRARQQRKLPQKAVGNEVNQTKMQGRPIASQQPSGFQSQQTTGYPPLQSTSCPPQQASSFPPQQSGGYQKQQSASLPHQQPGGYQIQQSSGFQSQQSTTYAAQQSSAGFGQQSTVFPAQQAAGFQPQHTLRAQSNSAQQQYGQVVPRKDVSSSAHTSQDDPAASEVQTASQLHAEALTSKDGSVSNSKGSDAAEKPSALHDSIEGNDTLQAQPVHSSLEQFGPRTENQGNLHQQWQNAQLNPSTVISDYQFQRILGARPSLAAALDAYKSDPRVYQLAAAQLRASLGQAQIARQLGQYQQQLRDQSASVSGAKSSFEGSAVAQAGQSSQAAQTVQAALATHPGQAAQAAQAAHVAHAAQVAHAAHVVHGAQATQLPPAAQTAHNAQAAQAQAQAQAQVAQAFQAAQMVAQEAQAVQVAQAAQAIQAMQAAQAGQGDHAAQAAIISKNASTAARLQFLSQLAQRGQNPNGLAPWLSGLVSRSGSNAAMFATRMLEGKGSESALASATPAQRIGNEELGRNRFSSLITPPPPKKRKELPALPPWREVISQSGGYVSSISGSELEWATATNRIPDKDPYDEVVDPADTRAVVLSRAKRRLRLTTHLMQQITPAVPAKFMQSTSSEDREGATYILSKLALAEACRLAAIAHRIRDAAAARDEEETRIEKERELAIKEAEKSGQSIAGPAPKPTNIADRFKLRMKHLEDELQRLEASPSAVDLVRELQDTERFGLVNRLAVHHSNLYSQQNSDSPQRAAPQKYVTTVQMPNKLPEGLMCISL